MVATERIKLAVTEDELDVLRIEKEALKRALKLIEGENHTLRQSAPRAKSSSPTNHTQQRNYDFELDITSPIPISRSRSSSEVAIKSRPSSLILESSVPLPPSPAPDFDSYHIDSTHDDNDEKPPPSPLETPTSNDSQTTPRIPYSTSLPFASSTSSSSSPASSPYMSQFESQPSPWADVPSLSKSSSPAPPSSLSDTEEGAIYGAALAMR